MDEKAYLPSGRKSFYYYQYRRDMIERSEAALGRNVPQEPLLGSRQCSEPPAPPPPSVGQCFEPPPPPPPSAARRGRKRKTLGESTADCAKPFAASAGIVMATLTTFLEAWRVECPWIVVAKSIGMFTRCGVCDYLKLLIERCPREEHNLREFLKDRLGHHFDFQAAQRFAHARMEEEASVAQGRIG